LLHELAACGSTGEGDTLTLDEADGYSRASRQTFDFLPRGARW
jgi:hypothetical protein